MGLPSKHEPPTVDRTEQFIRLLAQHERRLVAYVLALVPKWADADEIVQETKIRLWQQFENYRPNEDFGAWACAIAHFQILTYRKRMGRERVRFSDQFAMAVAQHVTNVENTSQREAALSDCLEKLSQVNREIIRRYYTGEAPIETLARELARTASAIYKALATSRRFLHQCVERSLADDQLRQGERHA